MINRNKKNINQEINGVKKMVSDEIEKEETVKRGVN